MIPLKPGPESLRCMISQIPNNDHLELGSLHLSVMLLTYERIDIVTIIIVPFAPEVNQSRQTFTISTSRVPPGVVKSDATLSAIKKDIGKFAIKMMYQIV